MTAIYTPSVLFISLVILFVNLCDTFPTNDGVKSQYASAGNKTYIFVNMTLDWSSARAYCAQRYGGRLATIRNIHENDQVYSLLPNPGTSTLSVWIGGVCLIHGRSCFWINANDEICGYSHFHSGEPSLIKYDSYGDYYGGCLAFSTYYDNTWWWVDNQCFFEHPFVCEITK